MTANVTAHARQPMAKQPMPFASHVAGEQITLARAVAEARRTGRSALAAIRQLRGLGQGELALNSGLRLSTVEAIEATSLARVDEVECLARALRCPADILP